MRVMIGALFGAGVLCDSLGTLAHSVLGQFTGQKESDGCLDLSAGDGGPLVVVSKTGSLGSDALKDIVDERIHDAHGLAGDTSVRVYLFHHFVDVYAIAFPSPPPSLLVSRASSLGLARCFLCAFGCGFRCHA